MMIETQMLQVINSGFAGALSVVLLLAVLGQFLLWRLFAFLTSLAEVVVAILLTSSFNQTLAKRIWGSVSLDIGPTASAVSTLLILVVTLLTLLGVYLEHNGGLSSTARTSAYP